MKTKLLKKCRKKIKFFERNGKFYVSTGSYLVPNGKTKEEALRYYRILIFRTAKEIFKFKPKTQLFKSHSPKISIIYIIKSKIGLMFYNKSQIEYIIFILLFGFLLLYLNIVNLKL